MGAVSMEGKMVSIYCPFCHRYTALSAATRSIPEREQPLPLVWKDIDDRSWWIGICNCCHNPVLVRETGLEIYPHPLPSPTDERIPEHIRNDLIEAKICFSVNAFRGCAVLARRALQSACLDRGASKDKLVNQVEEVASKGIITNDLKEWANVVRWVANDAAHPDKQAVTKEDSEDVLKLAEQFLYVIYVAPAIAKERRGKRGK